MNASQSSCQNLFECSCPEIDELTKLAIENGASGSRLTGAGWGGCTVSIVETSKVNDVMHALKETYYKKKWPSIYEDPDAMKDVLFTSSPSQGASILQWQMKN